MMSNISRLSTALGLKFGPVRKGVTPRRVLELVLSDLVLIQADKAIATDPQVLSKYSGMTEAYRNVAHYIAPFKDIDVVAKPAVKNGSKAAKAVANGAKVAKAAAKV